MHARGLIHGVRSFFAISGCEVAFHSITIRLWVVSFRYRRFTAERKSATVVELCIMLTAAEYEAIGRLTVAFNEIEFFIEVYIANILDTPEWLRRSRELSHLCFPELTRAV